MPLPSEFVARAIAEGARVGGIDLDACTPETKRAFLRATATIRS